MINIIGHEKVKIILDKLLKEDKIGHAYLFFGKEGIGKKLMAINFAEKIMEKDGGNFNDTDFKIIFPEKDLIKVEEIRNLINEVYLKPTHSKRKVIIIDDADKMNVNAQNALLKVLEEPPIYATLILIVSNKEKIIKTILSRVTEIQFDSLSNEELRKIVGDKIDIDYARGSASKALSLLDGNYYDIAKELIELFDNKSFLDINKKINDIKSGDIDIIKLLEILKIMYHKDIKNDMYKKIKIIGIIDETIRNLGKNANLDLALDKLMIKICN